MTMKIMNVSGVLHEIVELLTTRHTATNGEADRESRKREKE